MDFDFAGLRQGARQTEHLRANRCLIYGQTVLHFESGLLFSWPPIWQPVERVEPVRAPALPPSVPCPRRDRPGSRQGPACTTTASVLQVQRPHTRAQPNSQNGRSLTRPIPPSHHLSPHRPPLPFPAAGRLLYPGTAGADYLALRYTSGSLFPAACPDPSRAPLRIRINHPSHTQPRGPSESHVTL